MILRSLNDQSVIWRSINHSIGFVDFGVGIRCTRDDPVFEVGLGIKRDEIF